MFYQYNDDGTVMAVIRGEKAPDHGNQVEEAKNHSLVDLGYDDNAREFFKIKLDNDGNHIKSAGKVEKGKVL